MIDNTQVVFYSTVLQCVTLNCTARLIIVLSLPQLFAVTLVSTFIQSEFSLLKVRITGLYFVGYGYKENI